MKYLSLGMDRYVRNNGRDLGDSGGNLGEKKKDGEGRRIVTTEECLALGQFFLDFDNVVFSFVFDKHCPIMD
jgi:hypothetical protein